jgi:cytoskeleton protein RodZ
MIERANEFGVSAAAAPAMSGDSANMSAGGILREAREAQDLPIEVIAAALKVSPRKLEALEADDIAALPDPVFARALAASVCRTLRIDAAPVLAKLPGSRSPGLAETEPTLGKAVRSTAARSDSRLSRPLLIVILLLLAGAATMFWLPQSLLDQVGDSMSRLTQREAPGEQTTEVPRPESAPPADNPAPEPAAPVAVLPPPAAAPEPSPAPASVAPASNDQIVFAAREEAWISVTEPDGKPLLQRNVKAGETVGVSSTRPLAVIVGRAAGVDVRVRGKPFNLAPFMSPGGVARFEVKP